MLDRRHRGGHTPRTYRYSGEHPELRDGGQYTLRYLADLFGLSPKTMHSRIRAKACKIVTDYDLRKANIKSPPKDKAIESRLECYADHVRAKWLRRKLV
jgi:hypothetical protein